MAWNTIGPANAIGYGSVLLAGPNGGDALTGSVVVYPVLNQRNLFWDGQSLCSIPDHVFNERKGYKIG